MAVDRGTDEQYDRAIKKLQQQIEDLQGEKEAKGRHENLATDRKNATKKDKSFQSYSSHESRNKIFGIKKLITERILSTLEEKPRSRRTSTSQWNVSSASRTAAYKLLKVTRWMLKDEDMIFDPLLRSDRETLDSAHVIDDICGLVPSEPHYSNAQDVILEIHSLSVNRLLQIYLTEENAQGLRRIDNALAEINLSSNQFDTNKLKILYNSVINQRDIMRPEDGAGIDVLDWREKLLKHTLEPLASHTKIHKHNFTAVVRDFIRLVLHVISNTSDWYTVDNESYDWFKRHQMKLSDLLITSESDLYICGRTLIDKAKVLIAVVEVKAQDKSGKIIATSSSTSESYPSKMKNEDHGKTNEESCTGCSGGNKDVRKRCFSNNSSSDDDETVSDEDNKDEEPDWPDFDDLEEESINSPPNDNLRRLMQDEKLVLRNYLPQLLGQLMCTFDLKTWGGREEYHGTYRLGIAVLGLSVQFVGMIIHHEDDELTRDQDAARLHARILRVPETLHSNEKLSTVVFLTRLFNLLQRKDRQVIMKILACAALLNARSCDHTFDKLCNPIV